MAVTLDTLKKERDRRYREANRERIRARDQERREKFPERDAANRQRYYDNNRGFRIAKMRGLSVVDNYRVEIETFYKEARRKTDETGIEHTVDHIEPLNGENSCGLHVPWNLQVMTRRDNDAKGNKS